MYGLLRWKCWTFKCDLGVQKYTIGRNIKLKRNWVHQHRVIILEDPVISSVVQGIYTIFPT